MWIIKKLKELECSLIAEVGFDGNTKCKKDLELTRERLGEGVKIRSKCQWYEKGERSINFFLNFEKKKRSVKALVKN